MLLEDPETQPVVSVASLWEVAIKSSIGRPDFQCDRHLLRRRLLENGYAELAVNGAHAVAVALLPQLHKDPFDRLLIAQGSGRRDHVADRRRGCRALHGPDPTAVRIFREYC